MIIYFHGFDATSPGNHEKVLQLQFVDEDVRFINYSTLHPRHDMQHLLKEVDKQKRFSDDQDAIIVGVGLGGFWAERIAFLSGLRSVIVNPNLWPEENMQGLIDRPEEYQDIKQKCVSEFRSKNGDGCLCILSKQDEILDTGRISDELSQFYNVNWDEHQKHKFKDLSHHLKAIAEFKKR
ncbi:alpha/beta hydrolase YcfP [Ferrimonas aestuarii]|uniref:Alpha/beta hydrolase n=1 Tax=Ferrimonas aestuarii TaxID=2569539 RepID=A0A4U1BRK5_9GAMM|nr:alpha/beta hydrolase YcfP [Ferrimonas aestuarii]TKB54479.1 alpha/beta hydrolase [Ferrimonas aestuarii]